VNQEVFSNLTVLVGYMARLQEHRGLNGAGGQDEDLAPNAQLACGPSGLWVEEMGFHTPDFSTRRQDA